MCRIIKRPTVVTFLVSSLALGIGVNAEGKLSHAEGEDRVPEAYDPLIAPMLPPSEEHQARKNRYISIDPSTNGANPVALKVTLSSMMRCSGDERRGCAWKCKGFWPDVFCTGEGDPICPAENPCEPKGCWHVCSGDLDMGCSTNAQCESAGAGSCISTGLCVEHGDVGLSWWVQEPEQNPSGCIPACTDEDWYARVDPDNKVFRSWTLDTLHIGDCEIVPVASYEVRACLPPDGTVCSEPFTIGTIENPAGGYYADVVGMGLEGGWTPPDGVVGHNDPRGYAYTKAGSIVAHHTWVDLEGPGSAPQYTLTAADLLQIYRGYGGYPYADTVFNRQPGECNGVCSDGTCNLGEDSCNCEQDCGSPPTAEGSCDDGVDEDCDSSIDCDDDDCAADSACTAPRERVIEWVPVDPPARMGNAVAVPNGTQVTLHLMVSGWDPNFDGNPALGAYQAMVDPAGYSSGDGTTLNPLGYPETPLDGALQAVAVCASDEANPEETFDPLSNCERDEDCPPTHPFCGARPGHVFFDGYFIQATALVSTVTTAYTWEAASSECEDGFRSDDGDAHYAGTLILEIPSDAAGTYTIGFKEEPGQTFLIACGGAPITGVTLRPAQITVCDEAISPPTLPADPKHQAKKNRYLSFSPGNDCPYALAYQLSLTSMKRCGGDDRRACIVDGDCPSVCDNHLNLQCTSNPICGGGSCVPTAPCVEHDDVGTVTKYVGTPFSHGCLPLNDCVGQSFANLSDTAVYRVWTEEVVHLADCEVVPSATYQIRATIDGATFSDPLTISTTSKPNVHYADCVGPVADGRFTPPDGFVSVLDIQAFLIAVQGRATAPHTTWVDLNGYSYSEPFCQPPNIWCIVPQQILGVSDLQTIKFGYVGQTYVQTPGQVDPGECPP